MNRLQNAPMPAGCCEEPEAGGAGARVYISTHGERPAAHTTSAGGYEIANTINIIPSDCGARTRFARAVALAWRGPTDIS